MSSDFWESGEYLADEWWIKFFNELCQLNRAIQGISYSHRTNDINELNSHFNDLAKSIETSAFWNHWKTKPVEDSDLFSEESGLSRAAEHYHTQKDQEQICECISLCNAMNLPLWVFREWDGYLIYGGDSCQFRIFSFVYSAFKQCEELVNKALQTRLTHGAIDFNDFFNDSFDDESSRDQANIEIVIKQFNAAIKEFVKLQWIKDHIKQETTRLVTEGFEVEQESPIPQDQLNDIETSDNVTWSKPDSPTRWAIVFDISAQTFKRRVKDGKIRAKKLSSKSYQIDIQDIPGNHK